MENEFLEDTWVNGNDRCEEGSSLFPLPPEDANIDHSLCNSSLPIFSSLGIVQFTEDATTPISTQYTPSSKICGLGGESSSGYARMLSPLRTPKKRYSTSQKGCNAIREGKKYTKSVRHNFRHYNILDKTGEGILASSISKGHRSISSVKHHVLRKFPVLKYQDETSEKGRCGVFAETPVRTGGFEGAHKATIRPIHAGQQRTFSTKQFPPSLSSVRRVSSVSFTTSRPADLHHDFTQLHLPPFFLYSGDQRERSLTASQSASPSLSGDDTACQHVLSLPRILSDYKEIKKLGGGSFGKVSLYSEESTGLLVAIKSMSLSDNQAFKRYQREKMILSSIRSHPYTVSLLGSWEDSSYVHLKMEYCPGGSVASLAERKRGQQERWDEFELLRFLTQMCMALEALHQADIAHVDVKPENILVDTQGDYCLSDFGCSVCLNADGNPQPGFGFHRSGKRIPSEDLLGAVEGSPLGNSTEDSSSLMGGNQQSMNSFDEGDYRYMCSDMLNSKKFIKEGDLYALGMSLYELMSGEALPREVDDFALFRQCIPLHHLQTQGYSENLIALLGSLLSDDPLQRPSARSVLQRMHPPPNLVGCLLHNNFSSAHLGRTSEMGAREDDTSIVVIPSESSLRDLFTSEATSPAEVRYFCTSLKLISFLLERDLEKFPLNDYKL